MLGPDETDEGRDNTPTEETPAPRRRRRAASRPAGPPEPVPDLGLDEPIPAAAAAATGDDAPVDVAAVVDAEVEDVQAITGSTTGEGPDTGQTDPAGDAAGQIPADPAADDTAADDTAADDTTAEGTTEEPPAVEDSAAGEPAAEVPDAGTAAAPLFAAPAFATAVTERRPRRRATAAAGPPAASVFTPPPPAPPAEPAAGGTAAEADSDDTVDDPAEDRPAPRSRGRSAARGRRRTATTAEAGDGEDSAISGDDGDEGGARAGRPQPDVNGILDMLPEAGSSPRRSRRRGGQRAAEEAPEEPGADAADDDPGEQATDAEDSSGDTSGDDSDDDNEGSRPRRRRRGGRTRRGRRNSSDESDQDDDDSDESSDGSGSSADDSDDSDERDSTDEDTSGGSSRSSRRRRRRRRSTGSDADLAVDPDDPPGTVVKIRESRNDEVTKLKGSTRLEAKRQRRKDGRGAQRKRTVITEAEFLARRESVDRTLLVRESAGRTEIAVLEDGVLVEHYVTRASQQSMIGNVYLGKVQNVLPSMEAAFVDVGRGRNAVLYAGEVNWDAAGLESGAARKIEAALKPGDPVLAQVSKDPVGHKGARLTAQISLPGRYLVYVPNGSMTGISRKLPEVERNRLKQVLRRVVPEGAGVIVRTAAEGASEEELERDVNRLKAQWEDIEKKSRSVSPPTRLYAEPDLAIKVVRDVFNEDFTHLVVQGDDTWDTLDGYVRHVAPDLAGRMSRWTPEPDAEQDLFVHHRVEEQIAKAVDRKVWLPSGGSLVIDRTEAMTVVDVNTGKYTGSGGNLEETVTKNNLEAAEEIVRQLRLRDIGGIIVVDFIDMVLESNRNLVLRRLVECLGRDRTKHQVAEVTSLGLVQMTRKKVGQGLVEAFSTVCESCQGRGIHLHAEPVENDDDAGGGDQGRSGGSGNGSGGGGRRRGGGRSGS